MGYISHVAKEIDVLKQLFENLSNTDKQQFLSEITSKTFIQKIIQPRKIKICPHCQSTDFVKNGKRNGRQNFHCRACNKDFDEKQVQFFLV